MTITMFITMLAAGSILSSLLTEAIKQAYRNANKEYSANIIALINSIVIGGGGTAAAYMLLGIDWSVNNIICLVGSTLAVWIICQVGYDKVRGAAIQLAGLSDSMKPQDSKKEGTDDV